MNLRQLRKINLLFALSLVEFSASQESAPAPLQDIRYSKNVLNASSSSPSSVVSSLSDSNRASQLFPSRRVMPGINEVSISSASNDGGRKVSMTVFNQDQQDQFLSSIAKKRVVIASHAFSNEMSETPTGFLRFSVNQGVRMGIEWSSTDDLLNGSRLPVITHAIRLVGLYETNNTMAGMSIRFSSLSWSDISTREIISTIDGSVTIEMDSFALHGNLSIKISFRANMNPEAPFSFKYDIDITGKPQYALSNSSFTLVKTVHSSLPKTVDDILTNSSLTNGPAHIQWINNAIVDGKNGSIEPLYRINSSHTDHSWTFQSDKTREAFLDSMCPNRTALIWKLPYFDSSFSWDPSLYLDQMVAIKAVHHAQKVLLSDTTTSSTFFASGSTQTITSYSIVPTSTTIASSNPAVPTDTASLTATVTRALPTLAPTLRIRSSSSKDGQITVALILTSFLIPILY